MPSHDHPPRESDRWDNPDFCPFCGESLVNGGAGFMDHVYVAPDCRERFDAWREQVSEDIGGEWSG